MDKSDVLEQAKRKRINNTTYYPPHYLHLQTYEDVDKKRKGSEEAKRARPADVEEPETREGEESPKKVCRTEGPVTRDSPPGDRNSLGTERGLTPWR
jgi:hypothetical protein